MRSRTDWTLRPLWSRSGLTFANFKEDWVEPRFLDEVLRELKLEEYWVPYGKDGKPKTALPKT